MLLGAGAGTSRVVGLLISPANENRRWLRTAASRSRRSTAPRRALHATAGLRLRPLKRNLYCDLGRDGHPENYCCRSVKQSITTLMAEIRPGGRVTGGCSCSAAWSARGTAEPHCSHTSIDTQAWPGDVASKWKCRNCRREVAQCKPTCVEDDRSRFVIGEQRGGTARAARYETPSTCDVPSILAASQSNAARSSPRRLQTRDFPAAESARRVDDSPMIAVDRFPLRRHGLAVLPALPRRLLLRRWQVEGFDFLSFGSMIVLRRRVHGDDQFPWQARSCAISSSTRFRACSRCESGAASLSGFDVRLLVVRARQAMLRDPAHFS